MHPSAKHSIATVYYFNGEKCACKADAKLQYMTMQAPSRFFAELYCVGKILLYGIRIWDPTFNCDVDDPDPTFHSGPRIRVLRLAFDEHRLLLFY